MTRNNFSVTYEVVTEESAEDGEAAEAGFVCENVGLREAIAEVYGAGGDVSCVEPNEWMPVNPRWVTVYGGPDLYTGAHENRSIHFPRSITPASARRIVRLMGAA